MRLHHIRHGRYIGFLLLLVAAPMFAGAFMPMDYALVTGFDIAAAFFILSVGRHWHEGAPDTIRKQALRDAEGRHTLLVLTLVIVFSVLAGLGTLLLHKAELSLPGFLFVVGTLIIAWIFGNLVYAFHYASYYYQRTADGTDRRGLDFPGRADPCFADFVNFSFVLGMTSQTADIAITDSVLRRVATLHGMTAYLFNLGVLALTVNVVATAL